MAKSTNSKKEDNKNVIETGKSSSEHKEDAATNEKAAPKAKGRGKKAAEEEKIDVEEAKHVNGNAKSSSSSQPKEEANTATKPKGRGKKAVEEQQHNDEDLNAKPSAEPKVETTKGRKLTKSNSTSNVNEIAPTAAKTRGRGKKAADEAEPVKQSSEPKEDQSKGRKAETKLTKSTSVSNVREAATLAAKPKGRGKKAAKLDDEDEDEEKLEAEEVKSSTEKTNGRKAESKLTQSNSASNLKESTKPRGRGAKKAAEEEKNDLVDVNEPKSNTAPAPKAKGRGKKAATDEPNNDEQKPVEEKTKSSKNTAETKPDTKVNSATAQKATKGRGKKATQIDDETEPSEEEINGHVNAEPETKSGSLLKRPAKNTKRATETEEKIEENDSMIKYSIENEPEDLASSKKKKTTRTAPTAIKAKK